MRDSVLQEFAGSGERAQKLVEDLFSDQPDCEASTRALRQRFTCLTTEQGAISQLFKEIRSRTPTGELKDEQLCEGLTKNAGEDIRLSLDLQARGTALISNLDSIQVCKTRYDEWIKTRAEKCPTTVPYCKQVFELWFKRFGDDLKPLAGITHDVKTARQQLTEIADNATVLAVIQRLECPR